MSIDVKADILIQPQLEDIANFMFNPKCYRIWITFISNELKKLKNVAKKISIKLKSIQNRLRQIAVRIIFCKFRLFPKVRYVCRFE